MGETRDFSENVVMLEDHDVDQNGTFVFEMNKSVLVMAKASWCGYCKTASPAFGEAAKKLRGRVVCACIQQDAGDSEAKLCDRIKKFVAIPGFPTFFLVKNGKIVKTFNGNRDAKSFVDFALSN
jgi:thiol-disulfide isomerase/thioredoxin